VESIRRPGSISARGPREGVSFNRLVIGIESGRQKEDGSDAADQLANNGDLQQARREIPVKTFLGRGRMFACPQDPSGKDTVEQRLHEAGTKKVFTLFAFEFQAESFFEGGADSFQWFETYDFDASESFTRIGSEKERDVFWRGHRGGFKLHSMVNKKYDRATP
jgi:hypothetical protein